MRVTSVQVAKDGESARLVYAQQKPDLVLLDIWMPDIDGISLLKEWSAAGSLESQVVIMSGHGTLETAVEATRLGAFDFVQKPLSLAKLLATVRKALDSRPQPKHRKRLLRIQCRLNRWATARSCNCCATVQSRPPTTLHR